MDSYARPHEPILSEIELLLFDLVSNLNSAQTMHRFHDPSAPPHPDVSGLDDLAEVKARVDAWVEERRRYMTQRGRLDPKPHASLETLWPSIDPPESLSILRSNGDDLLFKDFALCQRYTDEKRSPVRSWARHYIVGISVGEVSCRCIAQGGRSFCTTALQSNCQPPALDDFQMVRVSGMGVNFRTGEKRPTIMQLYLPGCYGKWSILKCGRHGNDEEIVEGE